SESLSFSSNRLLVVLYSFARVDSFLLRFSFAVNPAISILSSSCWLLVFSLSIVSFGSVGSLFASGECVCCSDSCLSILCLRCALYRSVLVSPTHRGGECLLWCDAS